MNSDSVETLLVDFEEVNCGFLHPIQAGAPGGSEQCSGMF